MADFDPNALLAAIRSAVAPTSAKVFCVQLWEPAAARLRLLVREIDRPISEAVVSQVDHWLIAQLHNQPLSSLASLMLTVPLRDFDAGARGTITALPFEITEAVSGILVLLTPRPIPSTALESLTALKPMLRALLGYHLEAKALAELLESTQDVLRTARDLIENPSPQTIVETLRQNLFKGRISSCAMLLYSPTGDSQFEQHAYVEIQGAWSRRLGSSVGVGLRLYLSDYPELLGRLDTDQIVYFPNARAIRSQFDPLVNGFLKIERARSLALIALKDRTQHLGILAVAADKPNAFQQTDLEQLRLISEYMTLSTYAQLVARRQEQQEQHLAAMLNAVHDGVVMVLPYGRGGHVFITNRHFKIMFEVADEVAEGVSLIDLLGRMRISEATRQELQTLWLSIPPRAPTVLRGEFHMVNQEGQPADIEWYSAPVYQDARVLGRVYTFHDVTPERTAARLRAAFLSRVSHELRTPLTSIRGFAEFILEAAGDNLPALAREYTEIILSSSRHLNNIFTDMIEIARADAGELKLSKSEAHLPDLIINAVARLELHYRNRGQQVVMELDDDLPHLMIDVDKILQVLTNLLSNAIKYSPEGGKIRIVTTYVRQGDEIPYTAPAEVVLPALLVTIRDQGKGLGRDEVDKVFMPFYRTEDVKQQRIEGVGLGLAVTRSIIEIHRGRIWAVPRGPVRGGCFMFTLPTP